MDNIALITDNGQKITYYELHKIMSEFSGIIRTRSLVGIITSNSLGSIISYISCIHNRDVVILMKEDIRDDFLKMYISEYCINYLWLPDCWQIDNIGNRISRFVYSKFGYSLYEISPEIKKKSDELALLLSTSGTTGGLKLVRLSYNNILSNTRAIIEYLNITENDTAITSLPMSYTYGLSIINTHLYAHATLLITDKKIYCREFWDFFRNNGATTISGVPYMYQMIRKLGIMKKDIPSLNTITVAGGKISMEDEDYYIEYSKKYNKKFIVMYGQTEATARISYRPYEKMCGKRGSIGIAIPGGEMWLEDTYGNRIKSPNTRGEIVYSGENVSLGYAESYIDLNRGNDLNKILHTADIGYFDEDGYFYVISRKDRCIKINGIRIDLDDMENKLRTKYPEYKIKCSCEKCFDYNLLKRIKIEISVNEHALLQTERVEEMKEYISEYFSISRKLFTVEELRGLKFVNGV